MSDWKDFKTSGNLESLIHFYGLTFTLWKYKQKIEAKEHNAEKGQSYVSIKKTVGKKYQDDLLLLACS